MYLFIHAVHSNAFACFINYNKYNYIINHFACLLYILIYHIKLSNIILILILNSNILYFFHFLLMCEFILLLFK